MWEARPFRNVSLVNTTVLYSCRARPVAVARPEAPPPTIMTSRREELAMIYAVQEKSRRMSMLSGVFLVAD